MRKCAPKQNGRTAAHTRWIAYNTLRGQYASAMEHAVLEQMWVEKNSCRHTDENGVVQNPSLSPCAEGISAVKALAIAQQQGQKIYTVSQDNRATALAKLPVSGAVGAEIRSAIEAGKTVTFHEKQVSAHGWAGYGFIIVDPETGAGAYLVEGKGNGGFLDNFNSGFAAACMIFISALVYFSAAPISFSLSAIIFALSFFLLAFNIAVLHLAALENDCGNRSANAFIALEIVLFLLPAFRIIYGLAGIAAGSVISFIASNTFVSAAPACLHLRRGR